jgi:hypothetical protein
MSLPTVMSRPSLLWPRSPSISLGWKGQDRRSFFLLVEEEDKIREELKPKVGRKDIEAMKRVRMFWFGIYFFFVVLEVVV